MIQLSPRGGRGMAGAKVIRRTIDPWAASAGATVDSQTSNSTLRFLEELGLSPLESNPPSKPSQKLTGAE